jgi:hypothetical protein
MGAGERDLADDAEARPPDQGHKQLQVSVSVRHLSAHPEPDKDRDPEESAPAELEEGVRVIGRPGAAGAGQHDNPS